MRHRRSGWVRSVAWSRVGPPLALDGPAFVAAGHDELRLFHRVQRERDTDGAFALAIVTQPPGIATPLHRHTREAEAFYVLEGRLTYRAGDETFELAEGCSIYLPRGIPHAFRVRGKAHARMIALTLPGGLMGLYDEVGVPAAEHRVPGRDGSSMEVEIPRWNQAAPRYGLEVVGPPIPE